MTLMCREQAALLIIDVQTRLLAAVHDAEHLLNHTLWLARLAQTMNVPIIISEHCVDKIGATEPSIMAAARDAVCVQKQDFSVWSEGCLNEAVLGGATQVVLAGIEAHVCVLQTALDLRRHGYAVFVVADAVGARCTTDVDLALARLRDAGCAIVSREMVAFEWLGSARDALFKTVHQQFIR